MQSPAEHSESHVEYGRRIKAIFAASSGNLVEWFDFYVYAFCSLYFSSSFFPKADPTVQLLQSAAIFAIGFLMRPLGGWMFGYIGDKYGRKRAMIISVCMMCFGSFAIAILPGYETLGIVAPLLLLLARMFQGLSVGGEYGATATYMSEVATKGRRGFLASFQYVTLVGGQLMASLVVVALQYFMAEQAMKEWGWRIPFALGAVLGLVALYLRRSLAETSEQKMRERADAGSLKALWECRRAFFLVLSFTAGGSLAFYTYTTYMQKYLVNSVGLPAPTANIIMTVALFFLMVIQPLFGWLSDIISRRTSMLIFGGLLTILTIPILTALKAATDPIIACAFVMSMLVMLSFYTSINGLLKAEMFPPQVRALGVGLSYAISNAIFGGSAEFVALWLKSIGHENFFFWYVTLMGVLVFVTSLTLHKGGEGTLEEKQAAYKAA